MKPITFGLLALTMDARSGTKGTKKKDPTIDEEIVALEKEHEDLTTELAELANSEDSGDLDEDGVARMEEIENELETLDRQLRVKNRLKKSQDDRRTAGRRTNDRTGGKPGDKPGRETLPAQPINEKDRSTHGFSSLGEFASFVGLATKARDGEKLQRLENAATTYGAESVGGDGGWLVPPDFSTAIWKKVNGQGSLLERCADFRTSRNSLVVPKDETTPWDNSTGIKVYWEGEGDSVPESKPKFELSTARLNKLMALIKITEELLEDAAGLESYLRFWTPVKMQARINTAIVRGNGVGKPLGILNSPSLITVTKETSQNAGSIIMPNILHMWNRLWADLRPNSVWLINQDVEPMLQGMAFIPTDPGPGGAANQMTAFSAINMTSLANAPNGTIFGRPILPIAPCSSVGTVGDIILTDLSQYMALRKAGAEGPQVDTSIHLHFDQAIDSFRFIFRVTGQPMWNSVITPENGNNTYSWAVTMETRS